MKIKKLALCLAVAGLIGTFGAGGTVSAASESTAPASSAASVKATPKAESKTISVNPKREMIDYIPDVVYAQVTSRGYQNVNLMMDIMKPHSSEPMPAIVFVTGGGFINANRANGLQLREHLAEHGYVVASITYRVAPTAKFPEPLNDVKSSIRYLRAHAEKFGIDPTRIGIIGGSAGGYLSAFAGTTSGTNEFDVGENLGLSSAVNCAVDLYGISDPTQIGMDFPEDVQKLHMSAGATEALWVNGSPVFGGKDGGIMADPDAAANANPINFISSTSAPMLLMHGTEDTVVSPGQTDLLYQALVKNGIPAERYLVKNAKHGGTYWVQDEVLNIITDFFDTYLMLD